MPQYLFSQGLLEICLAQRVQFPASVIHCASGGSALFDTQVIRYTVIGLLRSKSHAKSVSHPSSFHHEPSPLTLPV